jgi:hypothetical protein
MKHTALLTTMICVLGLAMSAVHAADVKSGTKSSNAATPATPFPGEGKAAIPALPGNPNARENVIANRKKSGTKSPNAATPATPFPGQGKAAIPALPGNPTAQANVIANRKKAELQRAEAADRAATAREQRDSRPEKVSVNRPTKPEFDRPHRK